jgi:hypothetical protein
MPMLKNVKYTIGGPEAPSGTAAARTHVIPIRALPGLDRKPTQQIDPVINGDDMDVAEWLVADSIEGPIPISPRACGGFGKLVKSLLGTEVAPAQIGACIRIRYTGASASCKLVADTGANTLTSAIGTAGAEVADAAFGAGGSLNLAAVASDTVGEVVALIEGYADYECDKLWGADNVVAGDIISVTSCQAKNTWCYFFFTAAGSGAYLRKYTPDFTDTERPTYSIQRDGFQDNFLYNGCVVDSLNLAAALKGMLEGDVNILGFTETGGQGASAVALESAKPFIFGTGGLSVGAVDYTYVRNINAAFANNHDPEGYGLGSVSRQYHAKGEKFTATGDLQLKLDANSFANRASIFSNARGSLSAFFSGKLISGSIYEWMLIDLPYVHLSAFDYPEQAGRLEAKIGWKAVYPGGSGIYQGPVNIYLVTADAGAY